THVVGRGGAERHAGTAQRRAHGARALLHPAGIVRIDRRAEGFRLPDRFARRQRLVRCDVRRGADRGFPRLRRGPALPDDHQTDAGMARVTQPMPSELPNGVLEKAARFVYMLFRAFVRVFSILLLLAAWEILARSGSFTHFQLPAFSEVVVRIGNDAWSGDLWINIALTLYRALTAFAICAVLGVIIGMAMSRNALA